MPASGVRLARTSDVDDIAEINVRAWRANYAGILPDDVLAALNASDLALEWGRSILNPPVPTQRLLVAVDADQVVGYAGIGPCQDPDADPSIGELLALEVDPDRVGSGHGSRLMAAAIDHLASMGITSAVTWSALRDERRRNFLQTAGWGPDSAFRDVAVAFDEEGDPIVVREVRLVTDFS